MTEKELDILWNKTNGVGLWFYLYNYNSNGLGLQESIRFVESSVNIK